VNFDVMEYHAGPLRWSLARFVPQAVREWQVGGTRIRLAVFVRVRARAGKRRPLHDH
jgi:hypothetical protein